MGLDEGQSRHALGMPVSPGQASADHKARAVLHQGVPHEAELRLLASALAVEPRVRVGGRGMGRVGARLAPEVRLRIAPARGRRLIRTLLGPEALHRGPCLDQGAVNREVLGGQQALDPGLDQDGGEELNGDVAIEQAVAILGEGGVVPGRIIDPKPHKPPEEKVVFEPLDDLALRAYGVKRLQEHGPQQLLGRDRGPPHLGVKRSELALQSRKRLVHNGSDRPQRVISPHPRLKIHIREQFACLLVQAPHAPLPSASGEMNHAQAHTASVFFSTPC